MGQTPDCVCADETPDCVCADALTSSTNSPTSNSPSRNETEAAKYKAAAVGTVKEYLSSSDIQEVSSSLSELQQPGMAYIFVKQVGIALWRCLA